MISDNESMKVDLIRLREALEASWDEQTSYRGVCATDNLALGQCYPTARVVQYFFPDTEIVEGEIWTGTSSEKHFWNLLRVSGVDYHIDWTWQQFSHGSVVRRWTVRDRETLGDSQATIARVQRLLASVKAYLASNAALT